MFGELIHSKTSWSIVLKYINRRELRVANPSALLKSMKSTMSYLSYSRVIVLSVTLAVAAMVHAQSFDTNFVELDTSKMISTSDSNYAISHQVFPSNWRSVSVNGEEVTVATKDNQVVMKRYSALTPEEKTSLENIKSTLTTIVRLGPFNVKSQTGFAKLTTFDRNGGSSTMGTGGNSGSSSSSSSSSSSTSSGGISITKTGKDSYIVSKSDFPFNWQRVFINEDLATVVYRDGRVSMLPQSVMRPDEKAKVIALRAEVEKSTKASEKIASSLTNSLKNPMDFVNKALGGIFG